MGLQLFLMAFVCVDSASVDIGSFVATFEELTGVCSAISSNFKDTSSFVFREVSNCQSNYK